MNVKRSTLIETLNKLSPGLAQKDIIEQNVCFRFHNDHIVTFDDGIFVSIPFESGVDGGVRAEELTKILAKLPSEDVTIFTEGTEFRLTCGKVRAGISILEVSYPPVSVSGEWQSFSPDLFSAIKMSEFSVSKNMTRPKFTCVHVKDRSVISSDGYRVTHIILQEPSPFDFLLPGFCLSKLKKYDPTHLLVDENWVHFKAGGLVFSVRKMEEEFFDEEKIASYTMVDGPTITLPDMTEALARCRIMTVTEVSFETKVELVFSTGKITCRGQKELGWVEEELDVDYTGPEFKIFINPFYLEQILNFTHDVVVGKDRCVFTGPNFKHVMVLIDV